MKLLIITDGKFLVENFKSDDFNNKYLPSLQQAGYEVNVIQDNCLFEGKLGDMDVWSSNIHRVELEGPEWADNSPEVLEAITDADVAVIHFSAFGAKIINAAKKLKLLCVMRSGVENVNVEACNAKGIKVVKAPGRVSEPVADLAVALMLNAHRHVSELDLKNIPWTEGKDKYYPNPKLMRDVTVGLVGCGIIGKKVAKRLSGFDCKIIAYDPYAKQEDLSTYNIELKSLEEVMSTSDIVSLHARLTPETKHMVGRKELEMMKPTACLINTARSGLCDYDALADLLEENKILSAALDVFDDEPLENDSRFYNMKNVILLPHISGMAGETYDMSYAVVHEDILHYAKGEELVNKAN